MEQIKNLKPIIEGMMRVLGWGIHSLTVQYEYDIIDNPDHVHNIQLVTTQGTFCFDVHCEPRSHTLHSILGDKTILRDEWVVTCVVQKDGGYGDPPYEDEVELASDPGLGVAIIHALLSELRTRMYDALPYIPDNTPFNIEEDIPQ